MIKSWVCAIDSWELKSHEETHVAQKGQGRCHQGSGTGAGSWREKEGFDETGDGMGVIFSEKRRGTPRKHSSDGEHECARRRKQALSEVWVSRLIEWEG